MNHIQSFLYSQSTKRSGRPVFLSVALVLALLTPLTAADAPEVEVHIDNEFIQTYRDHLGVWVRPGGQSLSSLAITFETTVEKIREVNGTIDRSEMIFVPMGLRYYNRIVSEGKGRRVVKLDARNMLWPVQNPAYTSRFGVRLGRMHSGLDLACEPNSIVLAAQDGIVLRTGWFGGLGRAIAIEHDNGLVTWYGHNNHVVLSEGEEVKRGQMIAFSGNTGRSTGPHVHFEVRYMNVALNPEDFIQPGLVRPNVIALEESPLDESLGSSALLD